MFYQECTPVGDILAQSETAKTPTYAQLMTTKQLYDIHIQTYTHVYNITQSCESMVQNIRENKIFYR